MTITIVWWGVKIELYYKMLLEFQQCMQVLFHEHLTIFISPKADR